MQEPGDELSDHPPTTAFRDVTIIGGGCYGTFYAGQLAVALGRGRIVARSITLVDRDPSCRAARDAGLEPPFHLELADWASYLDRWLDRPPPEAGDPDDAIVPSPLMPHLMAEWLMRWAVRHGAGREVALVPVEQPVGTPYDVAAPDGNRYVSFADWLCPTHCVEPHICPVIRGPRTWEMSEALVEYVARSRSARPMSGPALFITRHRAFGVGMFDVAEARAAREMVAAALAHAEGTDLLVGTISSCHGALSCVRVAPGWTTA